MTATLAIFDDLPAAPPMLDRAAVEQARLVRLARDHLVSSELSVGYPELAAGRMCNVLAARQWVKRQRSNGHLFVVDHHGATLVPTFQLDAAFDIDDRVAMAIERLSGVGLSGWAMWQWFTAVNPWVEARPVDVIGTSALDVAVDGLLDA